MTRSAVVDDLIEALATLPSIGAKTSERLAFHLLRIDRQEALGLATKIRAAVESTLTCRTCFNLDDVDPCRICADPDRDGSLVLVVEDPRDIGAFEAADFRGLFHVLQGRVSTTEGIGPSALTIPQLVRRVQSNAVREVCLATNPDLEGEATAKIVAEQVGAIDGVQVTRLARGLPAGANIGQVSSSILTDAVEGRRPLS